MGILLWIYVIFQVATRIKGAENCDELGILVYDDLGCSPIFDDANGDSCPVAYNCDGLEQWQDECYFRGRKYQVAETVNDSLTTLSCDAACHCTRFEEDPESRLKFRCAHIDCPEWLGYPLRPGCYRKFSLESCCSTGQVCVALDSVARCTSDGVTYMQDEVFYPKNTCLKCLCTDAFRNDSDLNQSPHCRRISCGTQLKSGRGQMVQKSCAPIYRKFTGDEGNNSHCCPFNWICPEGDEKLQGKSISSEMQCNFGGIQVAKGQFFERTDVKTNLGGDIKKMRCQCTVPPLLSCFEL